MNESINNCPMCGRVAALLQAGENSFLIHEFEHSVFVVGDHQFFRGYSLLLLKEHQRELHELEYADVLGIPFDFTAKPVISPPQPPRELILKSR